MTSKNMPADTLRLTQLNFSFDIAELEKYLGQHGHFCLLDWLLQQNLIEYSAYEAWRYGQQETLATGLNISSDTLNDLMASTELMGKALSLSAEPYDYFRWAEHSHKSLTAWTTPQGHQALTQHWLRTHDIPQLDLFMDNSAVICENEIHSALAGRQFETAQKKLERLTHFNAKHIKLGSYQDLINYGSHMQNSGAVDKENLANEIHALEYEVLPLAKETLGNNARDYLAFAWRRLGQSAAGLTYNPQQPMLDASYALMQIPDWSAAINHLKQIPTSLTSAPLLQRLVVCHERLQHHNEALILWCLLFELDCVAAEAAIITKISKPMWTLWEDFWDINDGGMKSFFPAFVLIKNLGLIHHLEKFPPLTTQSSKAMIQLLKIHNAGGDEVQAREAVQLISPALLRLYLNARKIK